MSDSACPAIALTIRQPWASLIVAGIKDVENRTWTTQAPRRVAVHAAKQWDRAWADSPAADVIAAFIAEHEPLPTGAIIGSVTVADVVRDNPSPWAEPDCWHWTLAEPEVFAKPIPMRGRLSLWHTRSEEPPPGLW